MKYSKYNIYLNYKNNIILYNTLNQNILALNSKVYEFITNTSISDIRVKNIEFFNNLKEKGFLISDSVDENLLIEKLIAETDEATDSYHLIVNPTLDCNFNCWYCFEQKQKGSNMSPAFLQASMKHIEKIVKTMPELKKFTLSFFGGEPLMFFKKIARPLILKLHEVIYRKKIVSNIHFTTNGYLLNDAIIKEMSELKVNSLQITFDGAREFHDKTRYPKSRVGSFDRIISNIKKILETTQINVILRVNYTYENINSIPDLLNEFHNTRNLDRLLLSLNQVWQDKEKKEQNINNVIDAIYYKAKTMGMSLKHPSSINKLKNSCYADKINQAVINYDGYVFKCNARDFKKEAALGALNSEGDIEWNNKLEKWMTSKFQTNLCRECSIFPVCAGGCRRLSFEANGSDYCIYDNDENKKKQMVLDMLLMEEI